VSDFSNLTNILYDTQPRAKKKTRTGPYRSQTYVYIKYGVISDIVLDVIN